jgi:acyl-CoA synthetase (NDP forming)
MKKTPGMGLCSQLNVFLSPQSVAVIGASDRPGSWGSFIMDGLVTWRYPGKIYPVNRNGGTVFGIPAYPDVESIQKPIELAVITIPENAVEDAIRVCGAQGVKGITIITAGFGESVEGGRARERAMVELASSYGMRILGPNVSGTFNLHARFNASGSPAQHLVATPLAAVCQGGYAFYDLLAAGHARGMGVGRFIHTGNECDLEVADFLRMFGDDPEVRGILMYLETLRDPRRFMGIVRDVTMEKPVVVHKAGTTAGGARAARSHTGALAGEGRVYEAAFAQSGVILSPTMELLLPLGHALIERPPMRGNRVGIITMGGSWGVALTDQLEGHELQVPELSPSLQARLRDLGMPPRASTRNPVDIGAAGFYQITLDTVVEMGREMLRSGEVDGLILHGLGRPGMGGEEALASRKTFFPIEKRLMADVQALQAETDRPVLIGCTLSPWESQAVHDLNREGIRIYHRLDEIAQILSGLYQRWRMTLPQGKSPGG